MKNVLIKIWLLFLLIFSFITVWSVSPDTLVVYEYVHVTDTIWVEKPLLPIKRSNELPQCRSVHKSEMQIELFSVNKAATISDNDIILSTTNINSDNMKPTALAVITLLNINTAVFPQSDIAHTLGFYVKGNSVSQIHWYPGISQYIDYFYEHNSNGYINEESYTEKNFGRYATNNLATLGFGLRYEYFLNQRFSLVSNAGYLLRGCTEGRKNYVSQETYPGGTVSLTEMTAQKNKFHNASADVSLKWRNKKKRSLNPYLYTGMRFDYTLWRQIEYQIDRANPFPESSYMYFNNFTYGLVYGAGVSIKQNLFFEVEANNDIGFVVKNDILKVRNMLFSFNLGYNFAGFKRKSH